MEEEPIARMVKDERKFLHDISNKLLIASSFSEFICRYFDKIPDVDEKIKQKQDKTYKAIKDIVSAVKQHKENIIANYGDYRNED